MEDEKNKNDKDMAITMIGNKDKYRDRQ